jgi:hypothetical protein
MEEKLVLHHYRAAQQLVPPNPGQRNVELWTKGPTDRPAAQADGAALTHRAVRPAT